MTTAPRLYGVSFGDGNNGVSRMYPAYYVMTNDPWALAAAATLSQFKPGAGQAWAERNMDVDGEAGYGIIAALYCPPCDDTPDGEYPELPDGVEYEDAEDGRNWSDHSGAWMLCEVAPEDGEPRDGVQVYDSLEAAFEPELLAMAKV